MGAFPDKTAAKIFFEALAPVYTRTALRDPQGRSDAAWIRPAPDDRVLDLACGPGTLCLALARTVASAYGLDLAENMAARARREARSLRLAQLHFGVGDTSALPFPAATFSLVTCRYSFANFPRPAPVVREMCRVTRPYGRIAVIEVVAPENAEQQQALNALERLRSPMPARLLRVHQLQRLFRRAGLQLVAAQVRRRLEPLENWLTLAEAGDDRRQRRRLERMVREQILKCDPGWHLGRVHSRWVYYPLVARLLWRKNG